MKKLNGTNGFLQNSAVSSGFLRNQRLPEVFCENMRLRHAEMPGKAMICKNQRETTNLAPLVFSFSLSLSIPLEPNFKTRATLKPRRKQQKHAWHHLHTCTPPPYALGASYTRSPCTFLVPFFSKSLHSNWKTLLHHVLSAPKLSLN